MKVVILGSGGSSGVPHIGCKCSVCLSDNVKNKRTRASLYIENQQDRILIDSSPDLRIQALSNDLDKIDGLLYTHNHADHVMGIDELKTFAHNMGGPVQTYGDSYTLGDLERRFGYIFLDPAAKENQCNNKANRKFPFARINLIYEDVPFAVGSTEVLGFRQMHGQGHTLGYRIGDFAYSTDVSFFTESDLAKLQGLKLWVLSCFGYGNYPAHLNLEQALSYVNEIKPETTILTHMGHEIEYEALSKLLPKGVLAAYDGMTFGL